MYESCLLLQCIASSEEMESSADEVRWRGCAYIERGEYETGRHVLQHQVGLFTTWTVRKSFLGFPLTVEVCVCLHTQQRANISIYGVLRLT